MPVRIIAAASAVLVLVSLTSCGVPAPSGSWPTQIAQSFMAQHPDGIMQVEGKADTAWTYEQGLMLEALHQMGRFTGEKQYDDYIRRNLAYYVNEDGSIRTYRVDEYNLDMIAGGRALLHMFDLTNQQKFRSAADLLRRQLREQPRTREGGFWHKKIYPYQMWLDGLYMAEPFYASYAVRFNDSQAFDDIADQFVFVYRHTRDSATGLCYHGWDESRQQKWAESSSGHSPSFWGRAMGWYVMGLVEVLEVFPQNHPRRGELVRILQELSAALLSFQDSATGMWYQVVDRAGDPGNYLESSASAMFAYAFAKGYNDHHLDARFFNAAKHAMQGLRDHCIFTDENGKLLLKDTCKGAGLGGNPYRDGSYLYYINVPRATNDMKGIGPLILAAIELERGTNHTGR